MTAKINKIEIFKIDLPFKKAFKHSLHSRGSSGSVFVKVCLDKNITGYGEGLPREYVTGETRDSVLTVLKEKLPGILLGKAFSSIEDAADLFSDISDLSGAAKCAVELAVLDGVGKFFNREVFRILGSVKKEKLVSSGVISSDATFFDILKIKLFGFKHVKVKVGDADDLKRVQAARVILGKDVDIRVDANCAWSAAEAIEKIHDMSRFRISAVEQPVKADDIKGLKRVTDAVPEKIIADESLCTVRDAERLSSDKACNIFNIRLSKCGGIVESGKILKIAKRNAIECQVGCQVGESGVLSAAGRSFASCVDYLRYFEGSYGKFLLKQDVTRENLTFGLGGCSGILKGPGLGIHVRDEVVLKYSKKKVEID